uniref:Uncharacterized protein n=1 Tax=Vitis vinifera TaxID=29760 RepID=F6I066_VITVI
MPVVSSHFLDGLDLCVVLREP